MTTPLVEAARRYLAPLAWEDTEDEQAETMAEGPEGDYWDNPVIARRASRAQTPLCSFAIRQACSGRVVWEYLVAEYYDEGDFRADSVDAAKEAAWNWYCERMAPAFRESSAPPPTGSLVAKVEELCAWATELRRAKWPPAEDWDRLFRLFASVREHAARSLLHREFGEKFLVEIQERNAERKKQMASGNKYDAGLDACEHIDALLVFIETMVERS